MQRKKRRLSRRSFLQASAAAAVAAPLASCGGGSDGGFRFFTDAEARTVEAACERLIPADEKDPGAAQAGVVRYIDRQLVGPLADMRGDYREGLAGMDRSSVAFAGKPVVELAAAEQERVLADMEKDDARKGFFVMLLDHAQQGFYGDPRHGGNRDGVSWKMLGIAYPPTRGRRHDPKWKKA